MGKIVSLAELSEIVGRSERVLIEWLEEGLPRIDRGDPGKASEYDTAAVVSWMLGQASAKRDATVEAERRRLLAAQATRAELELAARRGALVDVKEFGAGARRAAHEIRESLLAIPARIAPTLDPKNPNRARELVDTEVRRTLDALVRHLETIAAAERADVCTEGRESASAP